MRRRSTTLRRLAFPAIAVLLALACSTSAIAEDESALEQLTDFERAQLAEQVEGWDQLPPERQEKLARSVIRIRELPEDRRRALLERIERLKRSREAGRGPRPGRLKHHLDPRRRKSHRQRGELMKAVGAVLWDQLPAPTREAIDGTFGVRDRERVAMAFFRRLMGRIAARRVEAGVPAIEIGPDFPKEWRRELETLRAKAEAGDEGARKKLAHMSILHDLRRLGETLHQDGPPDEAAVRRFGAAVHERYPEDVDATVAELVKAAEDPETLRRYAPPHRGRGERRGGSPEEQARRLLGVLDQSSGLFRKYPELAESAKELKRLLRKMVGDRRPRDRTGPGRHEGPGGRRSGGPRGPGPRRGPKPPPDDG